MAQTLERHLLQTGQGRVTNMGLVLEAKMQKMTLVKPGEIRVGGDRGGPLHRRLPCTTTIAVTSTRRSTGTSSRTRLSRPIGKTQEEIGVIGCQRIGARFGRNGMRAQEVGNTSVEIAIQVSGCTHSHAKRAGLLRAARAEAGCCPTDMQNDVCYLFKCKRPKATWTLAQQNGPTLLPTTPA